MTFADSHCLRLLPRGVFVALSVLVSVFVNSAAQATPVLSLDLQDFPDVLAQFILVDYDAGTDSLTADGTAVQYDDDGVGDAEPILNGTFSLSSIIDDVGFTSGSLTITGTIPSLGFNSGTLLTGTLTDGGTPPPPGISDQLHFTFDDTGGDLAPSYSAGTGGIVMSFTGFPGDFSADFGSSSGAADISLVVPEPGSLTICALLSASLLGLSYRRRHSVDASR